MPNYTARYHEQWPSVVHFDVRLAKSNITEETCKIQNIFPKPGPYRDLIYQVASYLRGNGRPLHPRPLYAYVGVIHLCLACTQLNNVLIPIAAGYR